jgi:hypothetical protein
METSPMTASQTPARPFPSASLAILLAGALSLSRPQVSRAEDRVDYRYEDYSEDNGRIQVQTHAAYVEAELNSHVAVKGQFVYDAISGATPTGGPPAPGDPQVPTVVLQDIRRAGSLETAISYGEEPDGKHGRFVTTPQVAYSKESDYESLGLALNQTINFNQRNTALTVGVAQNWDEAKGFFQANFQSKETTDFLVGVRQILTPRTVLTVNLTLGYARGYLTDPYKGVNFSYSYPISFYDPSSVNFNSPELRPDSRFRQVGYASLLQYVDAVRGAAEASYRFHRDDWGVVAHTLEIAWHQKLGRRGRDMDPWVTLSPFFRFHHQSAADFYALQFAGDPNLPAGAVGAAQSDGFTILFADDPAFPGDATGTFTVPAHPKHYSSDYRLSQLNTFTFGLTAEIRVHEHVSLSASYKRYLMEGLDGVTLESTYPTAHVLTVGATIWF